jgi:hypothetical protein
MQTSRLGRATAPSSRAAIAWAVAAIVLGAAMTGLGQTVNAPDQVTRKARLREAGSDPNVMAGTEVNSRSKKSDVVAPAAKTPAGRTVCSIRFDNFTDLFTKTYIDGRFAGTIRPYGELEASAVPGTTVLYARADYDDGTADAWGPIRVTCQAKYLWRLTD